MARNLDRGFVCYLRGDLGAGKTCFVRGYLRALGYDGVVKSPTYTLLESYDIDDDQYYHLDLYRISDPEELEYLGVRDMDNGESSFFVEWPDYGAGFIMSADFEISITHEGDGRNFSVIGVSQKGQVIIDCLRNRCNKA